MVRLINRNNIKYFAAVVYRVLKLQEKLTFIKNINYPKQDPVIFAMWHANQFSVHGLENRGNVNVLISTSLDGDIVSYVCENWGFKVKRGSAGKKGAIASTLQLLECLKNNESIVLMVDGPRGPFHEVKKGAIALSRDSGVPIVPMHWYSPENTFKAFNSWDKMKCPVGICHIMNIYGDPIYTDGKTDEEVAKEVKEALLELERIAPAKYEEAKKSNLWKKTK